MTTSQVLDGLRTGAESNCRPFLEKSVPRFDMRARASRQRDERPHGTVVCDDHASQPARARAVWRTDSEARAWSSQIKSAWGRPSS